MKQGLLVLFMLTLLFVRGQYNVQTLLRTGIEDIVENRYEHAIVKCNKILSVKPDNWEAYFLRGASKFYLGDYYGASKDLSEGISIHPYYSEIYLFRGGSYQMLADYSKAIHDYERCIELDPANPSCYVNYGVILMLKDKFEQALDVFNNALDVNPAFSDANLYRGLCYTELKEFDSALVDFNIAAKANRFEEKIYIWRGKMYHDQEEYEKAYKEFDFALKLDVDNPLIYYYRGVTSYEMEKFDDALADFDKVLELDPLNALVYYNRAILRAEIGLYNDALEDYKKTIELNPKNLLAHYNLGILYLEQNNYESAGNEFTEAIEIYEQFYYAYLARAETLYKRGREKEALADQLTAQTIKEKNEDKIYSDSASFSKVVKFDADFVKQSERDLFISRKLLNKEAELKMSDEYFIAFECDSITGAEYFSAYMDKFNKEYGKQYSYEFTNHRCIDSSKIDIYFNNNNNAIIDKLNTGIFTAFDDNLNSAVTYFNTIIIQEPDFIAAYFNRAWVKSSMIDLLKSFDEMPTEISVSSKKLGNKTTEILPKKKIYDDYFDVIEDYNKVIELDSTLFFAWYNRGNINMKLYRYTEAIDDYTKALELNNSFKDAYYNRAIAYLKVSDTENACIDFGKAGELGMAEVYPLIRKMCK